MNRHSKSMLAMQFALLIVVATAALADGCLTPKAIHHTEAVLKAWADWRTAHPTWKPKVKACPPALVALPPVPVTLPDVDMSPVTDPQVELVQDIETTPIAQPVTLDTTSYEWMVPVDMGVPGSSERPRCTEKCCKDDDKKCSHPVPEPDTLALLLAGFGMIALRRASKRR